ncbi:TetR/AcrR family transcriptional regulator [Vibrio hippocampi]|nr:TetR/AcrR family transcriptional regulator [Vibrio hippocampi]
MQRSEKKRQQILEAASQLFSEQGYRINMEQIAKAANVSKQTVYAHFQNKDQLFATCMHERCAERVFDPNALDVELPLKQVLIDFGFNFQELLLDPQAKQTFHNAVSQSITHPDIAKTFIKMGAEQTTQVLTEYLEKKIDRGDLTLNLHSSAKSAASQLLLLFHGKSVYWSFFDLDSGETVAERRAYIQECVEMFLAANECKS